MGVLRFESSGAVCPVGKHCAEWALKYMGHCICSRRDGISFALGLVSVVGWAVAEIPQVMTSYINKSAEGLSIAFLLTWIIGDCFNILGCILEPATIPTQYYTAVLYLGSTVILFCQAIYYGHIYPRLRCRQQEAVKTGDGKKPNNDADAEEDNCFLSTKSLEPTKKPSLETPTSDIEKNLLGEPLLDDVRATRNAAQPKTKTMLSAVLITFFLGISGILVTGSNKEHVRGIEGLNLLKTSEGSVHDFLGIGIGTLLGWGMAVIYLCGRVPQICLNIKRGNTEGLNPLMFILALVANGSYVASILVNSLEWSKIFPNLPWLVESGGCFSLDCIIVAQIIYFHYRPRRTDQKYVS